MTRPHEGLLAPTLEERLAQLCRNYRQFRRETIPRERDTSRRHSVVACWSTVIADLENLLPPDGGVWSAPR